MSEPVVELREVVTRYGTRRVHDRISLAIQGGEVVAIVGGSGSGKTSLLREMALLQPPASGSIRLFGRDAYALSARGALALRRRMGVLFQRGALFSDLTVAGNVAVALEEQTSLSPRFVAELAALKIALSGLDPEAAPLYPAELSGGMTKRAGLARALALDPELLLLDEPGSGLDPLSADALDDLVLHLKRSLGLTVVMVTHDMASLWHVADRVVLLGEGRILGEGTMKELAASAVPAIRRFFQSPRSGRGGAWRPR